MSIYISQISTAFHDVSDSHVLIIEDSKENGYTFSASSTYEESVAVRTKERLEKIFAQYPVKEILEKHQNARLTKGLLRRIFVEMGVFGKEGPLLDFSSLKESKALFLDKAYKKNNF